MNRTFSSITLIVSLFLLFSANIFAQDSTLVERQEGIASWYGAEFEGRPTASGETFNSSLLTAAHPSLPFGTMLKVTNRHNGKSVIVRVNDRGPFVAARIIDVSRGAAERLDMIVTGTAPVIVESADANSPSSPVNPETVAPDQPIAAAPVNPEAVAPVNPEAAAPVNPEVAAPVKPEVVALPKLPPARLIPQIPANRDGKHYRIQVGSFKVERFAAEAFDRLERANLNPAYEKYQDMFRVVIPMVAGNRIEEYAAILGNLGFKEALIREERN